jgi:cbb3-type cytochrome oxidase maturation protein
MTVIFILIGCSLLLALVFLGAFFWSVKSGQNDDLVTPGYRVLFDDEEDKNSDLAD